MRRHRVHDRLSMSEVRTVPWSSRATIFARHGTLQRDERRNGSRVRHSCRARQGPRFRALVNEPERPSAWRVKRRGRQRRLQPRAPVTGAKGTTTLAPLSAADPAEITLETSAQYQRCVHFRTVLTQLSGTLRLETEHLTFVRKRGQRVFDGAIGEFHSYAPCYAGSGFHLWQGSVRHVLIFQRYGMTPVGSSTPIGLAITLEAIREAAENLPRATADARAWAAVLPQLVRSSPPVGVHVRPPFSPRKFWAVVSATVVGFTALLVGTILGVVALTG
jgi:hypothetical protein